jgi:hypothetical protein
MKKWIYILQIIWLICPGKTTISQEIGASASMDTSAMLIGDHVNFNIQVTVPEDNLISWPAFNDTLANKIEILEKSGIDTSSASAQGLRTYHQQLLITSFDSGLYTIPSINFYYGNRDDTITNIVRTNPLYLKVHTMEVDTTKAIKPIKPPLPAPYTFKEALPWIFLGLGIIALIFFIYYYIRKHKKTEPLFTLKPKPKLPPHVIALNNLKELRHKKLWQGGRTKKYYTDLTDIVRTYIEERFNINAIEMTTDEILSSIREKQINSMAQDKLRQTLNLADMVKFAKAKPLPLENDNSLNQSIDFVKDTIQQINELVDNQQENNTIQVLTDNKQE